MVDRPAVSSSNRAVLQHPQKGRLVALHDKPSEARTPPPPSRPWWAPCEAPAPSHCSPEMGLEQSSDRLLYVFPFSFFWLRVYFKGMLFFLKITNLDNLWPTVRPSMVLISTVLKSFYE